MDGSRESGAVDWAAVQIAAASRLGTGMGVGVRLSGGPQGRGYREELETARRMYLTPGAVAQLAGIVGLEGTKDSEPAARAAAEAFCRAFAAAATSTGPVPDVRDEWARRGLAGMITPPRAGPHSVSCSWGGHRSGAGPEL